MRKYRDDTPALNKMLNMLTEEEIETGFLKGHDSMPVDDTPGATFEEFKAMLEDALLTKSVGEAIEKARKDKNLTLEEVGQRVGVSRMRISQLEKAENIELSTLVRVASAMGYKVQIALQSEDGKVIVAG